MRFAVATPASFAVAQASLPLCSAKDTKKKLEILAFLGALVALVALGALVSLGRVTIPTEKIGNLHRENEKPPRRGEIKVRKNEMKLRKNEIKLPKNFSVPLWIFRNLSVKISDFLGRRGLVSLVLLVVLVILD